jgi:hypothetical protein
MNEKLVVHLMDEKKEQNWNGVDVDVLLLAANLMEEDEWH